jgi:hypothetical protein
VLARHHGQKKPKQTESSPADGIQLNFLDTSNIEIVALLQNLDINAMTPLEALTILSDLKKKARESGF